MKKVIKHKLINFALYVILAAYASCSLPEAAAMTVEAENATIKTVGAPILGGWNLSSNGIVGEYLRIQKSGTYNVVARAYGSALGGIWPLMALSVDGLARQTQTVDGQFC
jgi:hypothetical protein